MVIALVLFTVFKQFDGRAQTQDGVTYTPVSYTHLDVYKRQTHERSA